MYIIFHTDKVYYCWLWLTNDRPDLSSERAPHLDRTVTFNQKNKYLVMSLRRGSTPRQTDWLTLTLTWRLLTKEYACLYDCGRFRQKILFGEWKCEKNYSLCNLNEISISSYKSLPTRRLLHLKAEDPPLHRNPSNIEELPWAWNSIIKVKLYLGLNN
jgi:hypothetical protein